MTLPWGQPLGFNSTQVTLLCALKHNWRAAIFVTSLVERLTYILKSENQECALQEEAAIQIEFIRRDNFQYWSLPLIANPQILLWLNLRNNNPDHQPLQAVGAHCKFSCAICAWDWWRMIASGGNLRFYLWLQKSTTGLLSIPGSAPGWLSNCNILIQMLHQCRFMCQFKKKRIRKYIIDILNKLSLVAHLVCLCEPIIWSEKCTNKQMISFNNSFSIHFRTPSQYWHKRI